MHLLPRPMFTEINHFDYLFNHRLLSYERINQTVGIIISRIVKFRWTSAVIHVIIKLCLILHVRGLLETFYYINVHEAILVFDSN